MSPRLRMEAYPRVTVYLPGGTPGFTVLVIKPGEEFKLSEVVRLLGDRAEMGVGGSAADAFENAALKLAPPVVESADQLEARLSALPRVSFIRPPSR